MVETFTAIALMALQAGMPPAEDEDTGFPGIMVDSLAPSGESAGSREFDGSALNLAIPAPTAPEAEIRVDGRLDDAAWRQAAVLTAFTQFDPVEGIPASQSTEVRVLVTEEAIFFGVDARDREMGGVRATLTKRDGYGRSDDYVRFILDTFNDQRRAFVFQVNPLGVQGDGLWVEGSRGRDPIDWNPDFLWESAGIVDAGGYRAELKIPLKSLRFPDARVQDWGLQVVRRIQRSGHESSWAPITGDEANRLAQSGLLENLRGLKPGRFMEVNPVLTANRQGRWDPELESFQRGPASSDFGMNLAYGITTNLTLDATYNPDFSQVESDAGQITVNERFALYLPEKRPFFLEGTDVFSMPRNLVYTRSIVNPVGAAKLSGKVGPFSMAYIGAMDETAGAGDPMVNLLRIKGDVGSSSSLGMVYTDRTISGSEFNRVLGVDGRLVMARRYTLDVMAAGSADGNPGSGAEWGSLFLARFNRSSRSLSFNASFEDVTPDFRAASGFIRRVGMTQADARVGYTWRGGPGALVESWGPSLEVEGYWEREDFWAGTGPLESEVQLSFRAFFRNNIGTFLTYSRNSFSYGPEDYQGLYVASPELASLSHDGNPSPGPLVPGPDLRTFSPAAALFSGLDALRLRSWMSSWERVRLSLGASWSETPIFDRTGVPADVADSWSGDVGVTVYPTGSLQAEAGLRHVSLFRQRDGSRYSSATIPRLQARYQFTRALFARTIGEYSSQTSGDLLDPETGFPVARCDEGCTLRSSSDSFDFRLEGLLGYEPSPGTVVFLGYTRQMRDQASFRFQDVTTRADGLFLKVSYRFRM
ncbi:MAG: DUF5916 domain-containing protein [Longimicrobiales bacterium]